MKKQTKLLLVYPGDFFSPGWGRHLRLKPHLVYIFSLLKKMYTVTVLDVENEYARPESLADVQGLKAKIAERIESVPADVVALSCWSSLNYLSSRFIAEQVKQRRPETRVVVGGYHPTFVPEDFIYENNPFDHVIAGEINNFFKEVDPENQTDIQTYDIQPDYASYPYFQGQKTVGIFLGVGCPFQCRYCMEYKKKWQRLSVAKAVDLIEHLNRNLSIKYIAIFDACFGLEKKWRRALFSALIERRLDCYFWLETRIDLIDAVDLELMSRLNVKVDFGVDAFSETMLGIMNKTKHPAAYLEKCLDVSSICNRLKILHDIFLIFNHPGESRQTYAEFKHFFSSRVMPLLADGYLRIKYQRFSYFPGSYVYNHRQNYTDKYGFQVNCPEWWKREEDHYQASRAVIPSVDSDGKPFFVPLKETAAMVKRFNRRAKEPSLWERLHAF